MKQIPRQLGVVLFWSHEASEHPCVLQQIDSGQFNKLDEFWLV